MNPVEKALAELSRLRSVTEPVVSLYLDVRWSDELKREQALLFLREASRRALGHTLPDGPGMHGLRRTLQRIEDFVEGLTRHEVAGHERGLVIFACEELGLWRELRVGFTFPDTLETDGFPHLLQLARLREDGVPAVVVVPSAQGADVYRVEMGALVLEASLRDEPSWAEQARTGTAVGKHGRESDRDAKEERHERNLERKNRQAGAKEATHLFDQDPRSVVVLVGTTENVAAFERELPDRVKARVVARFPRPRAWETDDGERRSGVLAHAGAAVAGAEEREERELVDHLVGEALRGGLAVVGPEDVVAAVNQRRVYRLVLAGDLGGTGWACDGCDAMGANAESAEECPYCGGEVHVLRSLAEALVARTLAEGGQVEVIGPERKLGSYRGVGAFLRQTAATGLRGVSRPRMQESGAGR